MKYEIMAILDPRKTEKELEKTVNEIKKIFSENGLAFIEEDIWGNRDLSYKIKGLKVGYYVIMTFEGEQEGLPEIHKDLRLMNEVVRYLLQKMPDSYSLMRYEKKAAKAAANAHVRELQEKITRKSKKVEPKEEKTKEASEENLTKSKDEASVIARDHADNKEETAQEEADSETAQEPVEEAAKEVVEKEEEEKEEKKSDDKLDAKLKAIIDDTDINF